MILVNKFENNVSNKFSKQTFSILLLKYSLPVFSEHSFLLCLPKTAQYILFNSKNKKYLTHGNNGILSLLTALVTFSPLTKSIEGWYWSMANPHKHMENPSHKEHH